MQVRLRMVSISQLRICFFSLRTTIEVILASILWVLILADKKYAEIFYAEICHFLVPTYIFFFSFFFSAFRNSNLKMKGYKGQWPKTANHIWVALFKKQLEKTVNTRKKRRIWKVAKIAILLTLHNYGKASEKWPFWAELRNSQNSRKMTLEVK